MVHDWNEHLQMLLMVKDRDLLDRLIAKMLKDGHCFAVETDGPGQWFFWTTERGAEKIIDVV